MIIGAGVAGLFAATQLPDGRSVIVIDKGVPGRGGSSPLAQGGMAVAIGVSDSPRRHADDTLRAGDGLCDPAAVRMLTEQGPRRLEQLLELGADFDRTSDGDLHLAREGGQSVGRSVHRVDATGAEMVRALRLAAAPRVARLPATAISLARTEGGRIGGVWVLTEDGPQLVRAGAVLLATGGCGGLFAATTNHDGATADGLALAWHVGASVRDLEFVQFHPTALAVPGTWRLLLTEALRGAGATLHAADGGRFMVGLHPDAELAPRHVVAKAIVDQEGGAWLDATHLGADRLAEEFPTVLAGARTHGFDLATERVPVTPAAHYQVGGVRTDLDGRASVPGLYAAGEVASTGAHGANRMAGNSLLEALVFGGRAADAIAAEGAAPADGAVAPPQLGAPSDVDLEGVRSDLRTLMWRRCGPVRDAGGLHEAAGELGVLDQRLGPPAADAAHVELRHAVTAARLLVRAAQARTESRGGHWRDDHPAPDPRWDGAHLEWIDPAPDD